MNEMIEFSNFIGSMIEEVAAFIVNLHPGMLFFAAVMFLAGFIAYLFIKLKLEARKVYGD